MSIKVENINKWYGDNQALNEVTFSIEKGSIVGFLGPNGAGKSTLMKILTTFISPSSGKGYLPERRCYQVCSRQISSLLYERTDKL